MDRAAEYLCRAVEAERKAAKARDTKTKLQFMDLADTWRDLAHLAGAQRAPAVAASTRRPSTEAAGRLR
jgi:hypothetical protein